MTASNAVSGYGTLIELSDGGGTPVWTPIAEVVSITPNAKTRKIIEATHLSSPDGVREFIGGLVDNGEVDMVIHLIPTDATVADLISNSQNTNGVAAFRSWRIVFPDFVTQTTATVSTTTWTCATALHTVTPVRFTTSGALPAAITASKVYFARRLSSTTFSIHTSAADALAGANAVSSATAGSGTHKVWTGTVLTFSAATQDFNPAIPLDDKMTCNVKLKITGKATVGVTV